MLNEFILPAIKSNAPLADNPKEVSYLHAAIDTAANPVQPVPELPAIASEISGKLYQLEENQNGWKKMVLLFEPGSSTARVSTTGDNDFEEIGLDNIYRPSTVSENPYMMRGRWVDNQTFLAEWIALPLGNNFSYEIRLKYSGKDIEISIQPPIFAGEPTIIKGTR